MPKTIIVPLDGTQYAERALAPARMLARQSDADLVLVMGRLGGVAEPESYLNAAAGRARIEHARTVVFDDMIGATAIKFLADTEPEPMLCMATRARNGLGQALFGGTTEEVIRHTRAFRSCSSGRRLSMPASGASTKSSSASTDLPPPRPSFRSRPSSLAISSSRS